MLPIPFSHMRKEMAQAVFFKMNECAHWFSQCLGLVLTIVHSCDLRQGPYTTLGFIFLTGKIIVLNTEGLL